MIDSKELQVAIEAARAGGAKLLEFDGPSLDRTIKTDEWDFVTEADVASEREVLRVLQAHFPDDTILAEESGWINGNEHATTYWVIDPLDGTHNFATGSHHYGVMISRVTDNELLVGVIYNPVLDILAYAQKGAGAWYNGKLVEKVEMATAENSQLIINYWHDFPHTPTLSSIKSHFQEKGKTVEGPGSSASIALGLVSGEYQLWNSHAWQPWDYLPLTLLAKEAGLIVTDIHGKELDLNRSDQSMLAAVPGVYEEIRALVDTIESKQ